MKDPEMVKQLMESQGCDFNPEMANMLGCGPSV